MNDELLLNCPECDSGDVRFCEIGVRPYCGECKYRPPVNWGTKQESINAWNEKKRKIEGDIDGLFGDDKPEEKPVEPPGSKISMGENVGWITGPHAAVKAVQSLIVDGEGYRADISELGKGLKCLAIEYANLSAERDNLAARIKTCTAAMREAQELLKDGALGSIVDTVWCSGEGNITLWERLASAIDEAEE